MALRVQRADVHRPFLVPGGLPMAVLITVIPVAISISYATIVATESALGCAPKPHGCCSCRLRTAFLPLCARFSGLKSGTVQAHTFTQGSRLNGDPTAVPGEHERC